jgi:hypothetical protein
MGSWRHKGSIREASSSVVYIDECLDRKGGSSYDELALRCLIAPWEARTRLNTTYEV